MFPQPRTARARVAAAGERPRFTGSLQNVHRPAAGAQFPELRAAGTQGLPNALARQPVPQRAMIPLGLQGALAARPQMQTPTFRDLVPAYSVPGTAPRVSADPLSGVAPRFVPDFGQNVDARAVDYTALAGRAPAARVGGDVMGGAQAAMDLLDHYGGERVAAAGEAEVARGMGRSGVALGVEDRVRLETDLHKADVFQRYVSAQAELQTQVNLANQQAQVQWQGLVEETRMFGAQLQQERNLADQMARIQMTGMQAQFASQLAELAARRETVNAQLQQTQQQMLRAANEFDRTFAWQQQLDQFGARLETAAFNEGVRVADMSHQLGLMDLSGRLAAENARLALDASEFDWGRRIAALTLARQQQQAAGAPSLADVADFGRLYAFRGDHSPELDAFLDHSARTFGLLPETPAAGSVSFTPAAAPTRAQRAQSLPVAGNPYLNPIGGFGASLWSALTGDTAWGDFWRNPLTSGVR